MDKKIKYFLIILFIVSFLLRVSLSFFSPIKYWDETIYTNLGRNIILYHEYSFLHGFADFSPNWPLAGFRPPLLPLMIAFISLFTFNQFFLNLLIPILSSFGAVGIFLLSKKLFNQEIAVYSSVLFILSPLNIFWGSKILTDTLLVTMIIFSVYFFWSCFFEKSNTYRNAIFFGLFSGFAFLSRYSFIWFFPLFFIFLLIKYKNFKFLLEKKLFVGIITFFVITAPWFIYNYFLYGSLFGFLIQANEASLRWGGNSISFYFISFLKNFIVFIPFILLGILKDKKYKKDSKIFIALWFLIIFILASLMSHKEDRYLLSLLPPLCIFSAIGISKLKKYASLSFLLIVIILLINNITLFSSIYSSFNSDEQKCLFNTMDYIKNSNASYVVTENFSPVYFYILKPNIRVDNYTIISNLIDSDYKNKTVYYYYVEGDWFNLERENNNLKDKIIYECENFKVFDLSSTKKT